MKEIGKQWGSPCLLTHAYDLLSPLFNGSLQISTHEMEWIMRWPLFCELHNAWETTSKGWLRSTLNWEFDSTLQRILRPKSAMTIWSACQSMAPLLRSPLLVCNAHEQLLCIMSIKEQALCIKTNVCSLLSIIGWLKLSLILHLFFCTRNLLTLPAEILAINQLLKHLWAAVGEVTN